MGAKGIRAPESAFHALEPDTLQVTWVCGDEVSFKIKSVTENSKGTTFGPQKVSLVGLSGRRRSQKLTAFVVNWCVERPGFAVVVGGPGARPSFAGVERFRMRMEDGPWAGKENAPCGLAAVCNAVSLVRGNAVAEMFYNQIETVVIGSSFTRYAPDLDRMRKK